MDELENAFVDQQADGTISISSPTRVDVFSRFPLQFSSLDAVENLQGASCSIDEYFEIPQDLGIFDLIDGNLELRPMADAHHCAIQNMLVAKFTIRQSEPSQSSLNGLSIHIGATVRISRRRNRFRRPDISIGSFVPEGRTGYSPSNPPVFVLEVTSSSTRDTDLKKKVEDYERTRIRTYWVVDRNTQTILCYTLDSTSEKYGRPQIICLNERVSSPYFGCLSVRNIIISPSAEQILVSTRQRRSRETEAHRQAEESRRRAEESQRQAEESRRRSRNRELRLRRLLARSNISTDISSPSSSPPMSPSRSPPRRRRRIIAEEGVISE